MSDADIAAYANAAITRSLAEEQPERLGSPTSVRDASRAAAKMSHDARQPPSHARCIADASCRFTR
jgi:hypothetical protein